MIKLKKRLQEVLDYTHGTSNWRSQWMERMHREHKRVGNQSSDGLSTEVVIHFLASPSRTVCTKKKKKVIYNKVHRVAGGTDGHAKRTSGHPA